ncbi:alpha-ketoglutarate-dependent dioxygenase AlkB [uncultured Paraglaciecola sp.]|uniref:alpha-ketoglutarate-dependent dioxygenase AlkB family protein n=1 Tax=uncultured Paraglaciecola sp. TaxID=1765024 RepID=UPI0026231D8E|nr:alpha-ketoglutarate-dependent dioxygenase AlkB [uncultured Paraglaciecola sp.]
MQQSLFESHYDNTPLVLDMPDATLKYYPNFIAPKPATLLMLRLKQQLAWRQEQICIYGKSHKVPRLQAWYGDKDAKYQYSNLALHPLPWHSDLLALKQKCEALSKQSFNSVLANLYRNGNDSMGRHADNEPELGQQPTIASLSFGESRNLDFYHNTSKQKVRLPLDNGSLLLMSGDTQTHWQHGIAKVKKIIAPRINLTFRFVHQHKNITNYQ